MARLKVLFTISRLKVLVNISPSCASLGRRSGARLYNLSSRLLSENYYHQKNYDDDDDDNDDDDDKHRKNCETALDNV